MAETMRDLIEAACKAYGIAKQYVLASRMDGNEAVIVTVGGTKVRYKDGDKVTPLDPIRVDGIIRKKMRAITGAKK